MTVRSAPLTVVNARTAAGYLTAVAAAGAALGYAVHAGAAFAAYAHATRASRPEEQDDLLDWFMPLYDVAERHHVRVLAPAGVTLAAARDVDLFGSRVARSLFRARELLLGGGRRLDGAPPAAQDAGTGTAGLLGSALGMGWGLLAHERDREIVLGAATRPWEPQPVFRDLMPGEFSAFAEPDYVKIAWTLRVDPDGEGACVFRTETRAIATDVDARRKFRRYWALVSPGVALIRRVMLLPVKCEAERRAAHAATLSVEASRP